MNGLAASRDRSSISWRSAARAGLRHWGISLRHPLRRLGGFSHHPAVSVRACAGSWVLKLFPADQHAAFEQEHRATALLPPHVGPRLERAVSAIPGAEDWAALLIEALPGRALPVAQWKRQPKAVAKLLVRLHWHPKGISGRGLPTEVRGPRHLWEQAKRLCHAIGAKGLRGLPPSAGEAVQLARRRLPALDRVDLPALSRSSAILCHGDLPRNFWITPRGLRLIDFEWGHWGDSPREISALVVRAPLRLEEEQTLVSAYLREYGKGVGPLLRDWYPYYGAYRSIEPALRVLVVVHYAIAVIQEEFSMFGNRAAYLRFLIRRMAQLCRGLARDPE